MANFDVFNGDADGICALHQLRLAEPCGDATLVTGVKRDIGLLKRVPAQANDRVTVLDISLDRNREALHTLLARGVKVVYVDHHYAGEIPSHPALHAVIDPSPATCTSLLVDKMLAGRFRAWAVAAAFGDGLPDSARLAATPLNLSEAQLSMLRALGECLNYNAYGDSEADLFFHPAELYRRLHDYQDPFEFIATESVFTLCNKAIRQTWGWRWRSSRNEVCPGSSVYQLPDQPWARRVSGVFGNRLAQDEPGLAHAVLTKNASGGYLVSVRAPRERPSGADELCRQFESGGGRKAAAGINHLPENELARFLTSFRAAFDKESRS